MTTASAVPSHVPPDRIFEFDIYADPRVNEDVQGSYARVMRDAPDVFYTPNNGGHWMVKRFDEISQIVKEPEYFSAREMQIPRVPNPPVFIPLNLDPPDNTPYRNILMPHFSPKAVQALQPKLSHWAKLLVDEVAERGECDFAHDIAARYPVSIFMELMGMPVERLREFRSTAEEFFAARTETDYATVYPKVVGMLTEIIEEKRQHPDSALISHLVNVDMNGRKLSLDELQRTCFLLFLGGMHTVTNVLAFAYRQFAQDAALQQRLAANPELISNFVEEALRLYGVVNTPRLVNRDCERFGVKFKEGEMVLCVLAMGGRDDRVNPNPDVFDIDRPQKPYLAFSSGPHLCVGHILARAEMRTLTEEWLRRIPAFSLAPGARYIFHTGTVNSLDSLPLQWWDAKKG